MASGNGIGIEMQAEDDVVQRQQQQESRRSRTQSNASNGLCSNPMVYVALLPPLIFLVGLLLAHVLEAQQLATSRRFRIAKR